MQKVMMYKVGIFAYSKESALSKATKYAQEIIGDKEELKALEYRLNGMEEQYNIL